MQRQTLSGTTKGFLRPRVARIWCLLFLIFSSSTSVNVYAARITPAWDAEESAAGCKVYCGTASDVYTTAATYVIIPQSGHTIRYLTVDGKVVNGATSYTFSNINKNHTIKPCFGAMQVASVDRSMNENRH